MTRTAKPLFRQLSPRNDLKMIGPNDGTSPVNTAHSSLSRTDTYKATIFYRQTKTHEILSKSRFHWSNFETPSNGIALQPKVCEGWQVRLGPSLPWVGQKLEPGKGSATGTQYARLPHVCFDANTYLPRYLDGLRSRSRRSASEVDVVVAGLGRDFCHIQ